MESLTTENTNADRDKLIASLNRMYTLVTCDMYCRLHRFQGHYDDCAVNVRNWIIEELQRTP